MKRLAKFLNPTCGISLLAFLTAILLQLRLHAQIPLQKGDSLFAIGKFSESAHEYKRWLVMNADNNSDYPDLLFKIGNALQESGEYNDASFYLARAFNMMPAIDPKNCSPKFKTFFLECTYKLALNYVLSNQYSEALQIITGLSPDFSENEGFRFKILEIICHNYLQNFKEAKSISMAIFKYNPSKQNAIDSAYNHVIKFKLKKKSKAENLSLIPGLGQLYAGSPKSAISSVILVGGIGIFGLYSIYIGHYFLFAGTSAMLFRSTYMGGRNYAGLLVDEYNTKARFYQIQDLNRLILSE